MTAVEKIRIVNEDGPGQLLRFGSRCDFQKCGAKCCMVTTIEAMRHDGTEESKACVERRRDFLQRYFGKSLRVWFDNQQHTYVFILKRPCDELDLETLKCKVYDERPEICRLHPLPWDWTYRYNRKHCSYSFEDPWTIYPEQEPP